MNHEQALGLAIFDTQLWPDISSLPWHGSARRCPGGDGRSHGGHAAAARDDDVAVRRPGGGVASGHGGRDPAGILKQNIWLQPVFFRWKTANM